MENILNFIPQLQYIAALKTVTKIWSLHASFSENLRFHQTHKMASRTEKNIRTLSIPDLLIEKLLRVNELCCREVSTWLRYHETNFHAYGMSKFISYICWTDHGRIDYSKTAKQFTSEDLDIRILEHIHAALLPQDVNSLKDVLELCRVNTSFPFDNFNHDYDNDFERINSLPFEDYDIPESTHFKLFKSALYYENLPAMKYLYNHLLHEDKMQLARKSKIRGIRNVQIVFFLISKMDEIQQQHFFRDNGGLILNIIAQDVLLSEHFLSFLFLFIHIIHPQHFIIIFKNLVVGMTSKFLQKKRIPFVIEIWRKSPQHLKDEFFNSEYFYHMYQILYDFLSIHPKSSDNKKNSFDVVKLILSSVSDDHRRSFIMSRNGSCLCKDLILKRHWDGFILVIENIFSSEEDLIEFKELFFDQRGLILSIEIIEQNKNCGYLNKFLNFFLESEESVTHYIKYIPTTQEGLSAVNRKLRFYDVDCCNDFLNACFHSDDKFKFKEEYLQDVTHLENKLLRLIWNLILSSKFVRADQLISWTFEHNLHDVKSFKRESLFYYEHIYLSALIPLLTRRNANFERFKGCINWCGDNDPEAIDEIKSKFFSQDVLKRICTKLLKLRKFKMTNELLFWVLSNNEKRVGQ